MGQNGMESTRYIRPAAVYARLRERGPVAWCQLNGSRQVVASLTQVPCQSWRETLQSLRPVLTGQVRPPAWRAFASETGTAPATMGHASLLPGAIGWFGYEAGAWFEPMRTPRSSRPLPDAWWGLVAEYAVFDAADRLLGMSPGLVGETYIFSPKPAAPTGRFRPATDRAEYENGVRAVLGHLRAGDCYQVNLARQLVVDEPGDPLHVWLRLRASNPARRGMLIETPFGAVVSNSPERLLSTSGPNLLSVPIKGTCPLTTPAKTLLRSAKERAELTMIVDLVRSDLGRIAAAGSVRTGPRRVGKIGHVRHAMQRVYAQLGPGYDAFDAVAAVFPPGSVTGAPKVRAMEIIHELEQVPRGVYCGSLGWIGHQALELNVAIRTITIAENTAYLPVGAGIVIGSSPAREFEETELKAVRMLQALC